MAPTLPDQFRITQQVPGGEPIDLTQQASAASWSSAVPGGFGSAQITIPRLLTQKKRGFLGGITIEHEGRVLFEGRVEDAFTRGAKGSVTTELQAFGLQRLLTGSSVRRIWALRSSLGITGSSVARGSCSVGVLALSALTSNIFGRYDTANPSRFGFAIMGSAGTLSAKDCGQVGIALPTDLPAARLSFDLAPPASLPGGFVVTVHASSDLSTYTLVKEQALAAGVGASISVALGQGTIDIRVSIVSTFGTVVLAGQPQPLLPVYNVRLLGTPLNEDTAGGFYGGTILRDAVACAPGIYPGTVEDGADFVFAEFARVNRTSVLDVVQEIDKLYAREWAVWEGGRFDWITPDLKSPGWLVPLEECAGWEIEQSLDGVSNRSYVAYTDAADGLAKEAYADATSARNPYVRVGVQNDVIIQGVSGLTSITAPLLAAKISNDTGRWPGIKGSITLQAGQMIRAANGSREVPALALRAGDNITIRDLPVEDIYASGQDGQTVFHVTGVKASTDASVTLDLEGMTRRADVLLARLASVS